MCRREFPDLIEARFWAKVDRSGGPDACWPWRGRRSLDNYGRYTAGGRGGQEWLAHRFALQYALGRPLLATEYALHGCDNPPCCNPAHLRPGTQAENMQEMTARGRNGAHLWPGRMPRGEAHGSAVLSQADVAAIRRRLRAGETKTAIAMSFGVSRSTVSLIARGRTWQPLPEVAHG